METTSVMEGKYQFELHTRSTKLGHPEILDFKLTGTRREARWFARRLQKEYNDGTVTERWINQQP